MRTMFALLALTLPAAAQQGSAYNYCEANANSFGTTAHIGYVGSLNLADETFALTVTGCPNAPEGFGMFMCGQAQYRVPFGNGFLCIRPFNPGIQRMHPQRLMPGMISMGMGRAPSEFSMLQPGSSWNFQFWYRNSAAGGVGFNLSDALHVEFAP